MATTAVLPSIRVVYPSGLSILYENEIIEDKELRLFKFTANRDCVLYFTNRTDFGIDTLFLRADIRRILAGRDEEVDIDFEVYVRVDQHHDRGRGEPPRIHP